MNNHKISLPSGSGRAVCFPAGQPPKGTCDFATKKCLKECGNRVPNFQVERDAYKFFCEMSVEDIMLSLADEVQGTQNKTLTWFSESGDCPRVKTGKVLEIMRGLDIPQNGFTRNRELWAVSLNIPNVRMVLTLEDEKLANIVKEQGMVAVPNYHEYRVKILRSDKIWLCGSGGVTCGCGIVDEEDEEDETTEEDCGTCYKLLRGCYAA